MTPERFERIQSVLKARQTDLTVCMEQVDKPNNISAIIRTADAIGIHQVHAIWPKNSKLRTLGHTSAGAKNWVELITHETCEKALGVLKNQGMQIICTQLSPEAVDFRDIDYTLPTALILGQEKDGISAEAVAMADKLVSIPMQGMVQSLNVSVACAVILYEAQRQRQQANMYTKNKSSVSESTIQRVLFERGYPVLAQIAQRKKLAYPLIDDFGQIKAKASWWAKMQTTKTTRDKDKE